jgi:hypothetical protein
MIMNKKSLLFVLLVLLLIPVTTAFADRVVRSDELVTEDIAIGDDLIVREGAVVDANINVWGGDATIAGHVTGNLFVFGGDVEIAESAIVDGECVSFGGTVVSNNNAVTCSTFGNFDFKPDTAAAQIGSVLDFERFNPGNDGFSFFGTLGSALGFGLIALVIASVAPRHLSRVEDAVSHRPVASGTVGFLTLIATIAVGVVLAIISAILIIVCIGLLGVPVVLAIFALLALGYVLGWVAIGTLLGELLAERLQLKKLSLPLTAALGTVTLSFALGLIESLPLGGFGSSVASFVLGCVGLGAAALTKFGTRSYPRLLPTNPDKVQTAIDNMPLD